MSTALKLGNKNNSEDFNLNLNKVNKISSENIKVKKKNLDQEIDLNNYENKDNSKNGIENIEKKIRKDAKGNPIVKGNKNYKVTFKDLISKEKLVQYVEIEDHKKYNFANSHMSEPENDNVSCTCVIF